MAAPFGPTTINGNTVSIGDRTITLDPTDATGLSDQDKVSAALQLLSQSRQASPAPQAPQRTFAQRLVREGALPTIGGAIGGAAGGLIASPTVAGVPAGILAGESIGSAAGEGLNQWLGITEPSAAQIGLAAAGGPAGRAIGGLVNRGVRAIGRSLPGASVPLQEEGVRRARDIAARYQPPAASQGVYALLDQMNPSIPASGLGKAVAELRQVEQRLPEALRSSVAGVVEDLGTMLQQNGTLDFQTARGVLTRLGQRTGSVQGLEANELRGAFKRLSGALYDDLDAATVAGGQSGQAAELLKAANQTFRRERAVEGLTEAIEGAVGKARSDLLESFNPARALKAIREDPFLGKSFSPAELAQIEASLKALKALPSLPPVGGEAAIGSGRSLFRLGAGAAGGGLFDLPGGAMTGMAVTEGVHRLIATAVSTSAGRNLLHRTLNPHTGMLDHTGYGVLAAFLRPQTASRPDTAKPQP
jgi:hypothetical protein